MLAKMACPMWQAIFLCAALHEHGLFGRHPGELTLARTREGRGSSVGVPRSAPRAQQWSDEGRKFRSHCLGELRIVLSDLFDAHLTLAG